MQFLTRTISMTRHCRRSRSRDVQPLRIRQFHQSCGPLTPRLLDDGSSADEYMVTDEGLPISSPKIAALSEIAGNWQSASAPPDVFCFSTTSDGPVIEVEKVAGRKHECGSKISIVPELLAHFWEHMRLAVGERVLRSRLFLARQSNTQRKRKVRFGRDAEVRAGLTLHADRASQIRVTVCGFEPSFVVLFLTERRICSGSSLRFQFFSSLAFSRR